MRRRVAVFSTRCHLHVIPILHSVFYSRNNVINSLLDDIQGARKTEWKDNIHEITWYRYC